jgi:aryl-alcohol dehydrogenase-like predicted oxidoreductase
MNFVFMGIVMKEIKIGRSGLKVSKEGLGCMALSDFNSAKDNDDSMGLLSEALISGINFFDTADVYAYGQNERLLGRFINEQENRESLVIASKCGIVRDKSDTSKRGMNNSPEYIRLSCLESITRLDTHIDLYYLHRVVDDKKTLNNAMMAMAELLDEGKIKAVGLSEANEECIRYAHQCLLNLTQGRHGISAVQTEYSLMSRTVEANGVLAACKDLGITFVAYSPIGRGILSGEVTSLDNLDKDDFRRTLPRFSAENLKYNNLLISTIKNIAKKMDCTTAQLSLAWLMNKSPAVVPIPGTKHSRHLQENIAAMDIKVSPQDMSRLNAVSASFHAKGTRYSKQAMIDYGLSE